MTKINPLILKWARETAGLSIEEACEKLAIKDTKLFHATEKLIALESGEFEPTRTLLEIMVKKYHRPLIVFYMPDIPQPGNRGQDFRTLPPNYSSETIAIVDTLIRDIQVRQNIVRSALEDDDEIPSLQFINSMTINDGISQVLQKIIQLLDFNLENYRRKTNSNEAFTYLRTKIEDKGVFVLLIGDLGSHHTEIGLDFFRGFSLADDIAPFIVINDKDAKSAWSFTLIHEFVHLLLGQTGISGQYSDSEIEQFCNDIASEILLPKVEILEFRNIHTLEKEELIDKITRFAYARKVSSSMLAYKLFRCNYISKQLWMELSITYKNLWLLNKEVEKNKLKNKNGGPDYYVLRRSHVGLNLISLVQRMMITGSISSTKAGRVLGVNAKNIQNMFDFKGQHVRN